MTFSTEKLKLTISLSPETDQKLRLFAAKNRKHLSQVVEYALSRAFSDEEFIEFILTK
jgi:predicted transcriptional regulator